MDDFVVA